MSMPIRRFVRVLPAAAFLGATLAAALTGCGERSRPNILLLTLDTTRTDRLGYL